MKRAKDFFSPAELREIERVVKEAERRSAAEIVSQVVAHADDYPETAWKGAFFGVLAAILAALAIYRFADFWGGPGLLWISLPGMIGAAAGFLLALLWPAAKRALAGPRRMDQSVRQMARSVFLEKEIFHTRRRSGILVFVSLFERRVAVIGDSGINSRVAPAEWDAIAAGIAAGIRAGHPGPAIAAAVDACGRLLERHGLIGKPGDKNELPDGPLIGEE
jgi:putative membrane protein